MAGAAASTASSHATARARPFGKHEPSAITSTTKDRVAMEQPSLPVAVTTYVPTLPNVSAIVWLASGADARMVACVGDKGDD